MRGGLGRWFLRSPIAFATALSVIESIASIRYEALNNRLQAALIYVREVVSQAVDPTSITTSVIAELRYRGQGLELSIALEHDIDLPTAVLNAQSQFIDQYRAMSGFTLDDIDVELVSLSVSARGRELPVSSTKQVSTKLEPTATPVSIRQVYDPQAKSFKRSAVVPRSRLNGEMLYGPLVVSESQTTTLVPEAWCVHQAEQGHLILERRSS